MGFDTKLLLHEERWIFNWHWTLPKWNFVWTYGPWRSLVRGHGNYLTATWMLHLGSTYQSSSWDRICGNSTSYHKITTCLNVIEFDSLSSTFPWPIMLVDHLCCTSSSITKIKCTSLNKTKHLEVTTSSKFSPEERIPANLTRYTGTIGRHYQQSLIDVM